MTEHNPGFGSELAARIHNDNLFTVCSNGLLWEREKFYERRKDQKKYQLRTLTERGGWFLDIASHSQRQQYLSYEEFINTKKPENGNKIGK